MMEHPLLNAIMSGPDICLLSERSGVVAFANETALALFNCASIDELNKRIKAGSLKSAVGMQVLAQHQKVRNLNKKDAVLRTLIGEQEQDYWYSLYTWKVRDGAKGTGYVFSRGADLTTSPMAEEYLNIHRVLEALPDIVFAKDLDGKFTVANGAVAKMMHAKSADELIGRSDFDYYPPDLAKYYRDDELEMLETGKSLILEQPVLHEDGSRGYLCSLKVPLRDRRGKLVGYVGHGRDVTETRSAEYLVRQQEAELQEAQLLAGMGSLSWLVGTRKVTGSDGFRRLLGLPKKSRDVSVQQILKRIPREERHHLLKVATTVLRRKSRGKLQFTIKTHRGIKTIDAVVHFGRTFEEQPALFWSLHDVTKQVRVQSRLEELAFTDALTGIANRIAFFRRAEEILTEDDEADAPPRSMLLIDLDEFKPVNDSHGHAIGDKLLMRVAQRLKKCLRDGDLLARLGGDEFCVLLRGEEGAGRHDRVAKRVVKTIGAPYRIAGTKVKVSASVGIALDVSAREGVEGALARADCALYSVKKSGRNGFAYTTDKLVRARKPQARRNNRPTANKSAA